MPDAAVRMVIKRFPPVSRADSHGLLAFGGDLEVESLLLAYRSGIFPWPLEGETLAWFSPPTRALLFLEEFHIPRSLRKKVKGTNWRVEVDSDFASVITQCAASSHRGTQRGTWITPEMVDSYIELHMAGYAHSVECYAGRRLIGGLYGVSVGRMFAGESMFYLEPDASKMALVGLVSLLQAQGVTWIDCQVMTPHFELFGAREITRSDYLTLLAGAISGPALNFKNTRGNLLRAE